MSKNKRVLGKKKSQNKILTKRLEDKFEELFQKPEQNTKEVKYGNKKNKKIKGFDLEDLTFNDQEPQEERTEKMEKVKLSVN